MTSPVDRPAGLYEALEPHLAAARLPPYLTVVAGNRRLAIQLYQWNMTLSGAVYEALHVVEIVLRNAIDAQLCLWNAAQIDAQTGNLRAQYTNMRTVLREIDPAVERWFTSNQRVTTALRSRPPTNER